ncbi:MAG TPA: DUF488 domain-containing protein [Chloroflexota bacterium]|nr:DUF488 domain-containing protein [Chloroflexota bacterium]
MGHPPSVTTGSAAGNARIKRAYEPAGEGDGYRVLVDRLWPRGVSKEKARLGTWMKEIAPSTELRRWFGHDPARWDEFERRYRAELAEPERRQLVKELADRARHGPVTLVYGARDTLHNEAVVIAVIVSLGD